MPDAETSLKQSIKAHERWGRTPDKTAATAPARRAAESRFLTQVREEYPDLDEGRVRELAEHRRKAWFKKLALASVQARKARAKADALDAQVAAELESLAEAVD